MERGAGQATAAGARGGQEAFAGLGARIAALWQSLKQAIAAAIAQEIAYRRLFLLLPVASGAGVVLYFNATHEPSVLACAIAFALLSCAAFAVRSRRALFIPALGLAAIAAGFLSGAWRTARVAAPVLTRTIISQVTGTIEAVDHRREGARLVVRLASAEGLAANAMPYRVRLTTRRAPGIEAGAFVAMKARMLPPARAALPGGYDFARDAYFARIGGVGNVLGKIETRPSPEPVTWAMQFHAGIDRLRNALVHRIAAVLDGDTAAIAAHMVTGKRDLLTEQAKELIREAGIFHIITISGVQMTLVAGIFFVGLRRLLATSRTLALNYPIKKWAAGAAIVGAILYDIATGSRVGTERALVMTVIMLGAVMFDRPSVSMRNLGFAALFVIAFEPEALLGASFQLSFAAVAALVAVWEARLAAQARARGTPLAPLPNGRVAGLVGRISEARWHGLGAILFATTCATAATASFMAANFHELSLYVLIGNPLTLAMIEFFAVPAALIGTLLYPFGWDGPVWHYLALGIELVLWAARIIAAAPGSTLHLPAFAPWAIVFLSLAVLSMVVWRTSLMRSTALVFAAIGLWGALHGPRFDVVIAPTGDGAAVRGSDGKLAVIAARPSNFTSEQWLRADADGRHPETVREPGCDSLGCVGRLADGRAIVIVQDGAALVEDCAKAAVLVARFMVSTGCGAPLIVDRRMLETSGAVALRLEIGAFVRTDARAAGEDRPWSRAALYQKLRPLRPASSERSGALQSDLESGGASRADALD